MQKLTKHQEIEMNLLLLKSCIKTLKNLGVKYDSCLLCGAGLSKEQIKRLTNKKYVK